MVTMSQFCLARWPADAQPIGPDGTFLTQLSSYYFAQPCISPRAAPTGAVAAASPFLVLGLLSLTQKSPSRYGKGARNLIHYLS